MSDDEWIEGIGRHGAVEAYGRCDGDPCVSCQEREFHDLDRTGVYRVCAREIEALRAEVERLATCVQTLKAEWSREFALRETVEARAERAEAQAAKLGEIHDRQIEALGRLAERAEKAEAEVGRLKELVDVQHVEIEDAGRTYVGERYDRAALAPAREGES